MKLNVFLSPVIVDELYFTGKTTVVIDVLRATSTIVTAINNGAKEVVPVASVDLLLKFLAECLVDKFYWRGKKYVKRSKVLPLVIPLLNILKNLVEGKTIVFYTTNGTKSIAKAKYSENLYTCSFLNISAVAKHLITLNTDVEIVCAGRNNYFSIEDSVCAGMLISKISKVKTDSFLNDSGAAVLTLYEKYGANLIKMMRESDHGKILLENGFEADLEYCSSIDILDDIPSYANGVLKKLKSN